MANIPEVHIPPQTILEVGPFAISNAMITMFTTSLILIIFALLVRKNAGIKPSRLQVAFEMLFEYILNQMTIAFNSESKARKFLPLIMTILLILLVGNQFMLIPFAESIVTADGVNLFRSPASHYALPITLTVVVLLLAHVLAFFTHPIRHIGQFIKLDVFFKMKSIKDLPMAMIDFFLGLLDIVGEVAKLISLATRLFGNMFAGGIIVMIISGLMFYTQFLVPIPFLALGILSGFVQAFVFAMLSILFISSTTNAVLDSTKS